MTGPLIGIENAANTLQADLTAAIEGEVRFDRISRALYSTDASVYQIEPRGVVIPRHREDIVRAVAIARRHRCSVTLRGGGTSQAGQAIGEGIQIDTSKHYNRLLEVNAEARWARVEPGIVLDELNELLKPHGLRFAPDISTASRATVGGMMANNSAGARSVLYGKTIDHVLEQTVLFADGEIHRLRPLDGDELDRACTGEGIAADGYRAVRNLAAELRGEIERRYPKVLRRVGGYNLDEFTDPGRPFNLSKLIVGSEGTLGVILEAKLNLVPLPKAKALMTIQFAELLDALAATPAILAHRPSAVEVMDGFILDHTRQNPALHRQRETFIQGDPGAVLCIEFYGDDAAELPPRLEALEADMRVRGWGEHFYTATTAAAQARVWGIREAALGLSMAMKDDNKSLSFVEDTAVAPERLRDYIERFLAIVRRHDTVAGVYAHASVGCLHVRPVVNLKTEDGVRKFEAIANEVADLVLEFGGALSGEHGDGLVRGPFMEKMFGPVLYQAFRTIKRTFDPHGLFNPGKIVDAPPLTQNLRYGAGYRAASPETYFDFGEHGGLAGAVEMCSGLGACRKKLSGTMCPSYMATGEEMHTTRGRANALRLAMSGRLGEAGLDDDGIAAVLDLCLECRACKSECPVGVDMARFKSEFLARRWERNGTPLRARVLGNVRLLAEIGSRLSPLANRLASSGLARMVNHDLLGIDSRRPLPAWAGETLTERLAKRPPFHASVLLFNDTFTNYYDPSIGVAAAQLLEAAGRPAALAPNVCCGRPLISQGLLDPARELAARNTRLLHDAAARGVPLVFCEPSCLSAIREDAPDLLRGERQEQARVVARSAVMLEDFLLRECADALHFRSGPKRVLLHGHCHQRSMGLVASAQSLLARIPGAEVVDLDAGCCGMAGSFGYAREHYDVSRAIAERKLLPAARGMREGDILAAAGTSCRHQVADLAGATARHPAEILASLLVTG
ncbi:MAG: FAD-linked oxidase C-terminal domain-containing protein [Bryobacteraceae bacterium]